MYFHKIYVKFRARLTHRHFTYPLPLHALGYIFRYICLSLPCVFRVFKKINYPTPRMAFPKVFGQRHPGCPTVTDSYLETIAARDRVWYALHRDRALQTRPYKNIHLLFQAIEEKLSLQPKAKIYANSNHLLKTFY